MSVWKAVPDSLGKRRNHLFFSNKEGGFMAAFFSN
jgi:hypothetical protein